jgi:hypothetical protein
MPDSTRGGEMIDHKARLYLAAVALGALVPAGAVFAADMPVKARPLAAAAYYDWSGVYVGVHAGYGGGMKDWNGPPTTDLAARGFLGGGQIGINKQIASLVFGLELDGSWANIGRSQTISFGGALLGFQQDLTATSKVDGLVTFAGRAGLAADRWFVYQGWPCSRARNPLFQHQCVQYPGRSRFGSKHLGEWQRDPMVSYGRLRGGICAGE